MKVDKLIQEIEKHENEIERLKLLLHNVSGSDIDICPNCKTKNYHWSTDNKWSCAFC